MVDEVKIRDFVRKRGFNIADFVIIQANSYIMTAKKRKGGARYIMELKKLDFELSVCKVSRITEDVSLSDFYFIGKTDEELSLVCRTECVPAETIEREDGWKGFRIQGTLDFALVGILAPIADILAENRIGIFAVSTYNTDYVLVKKENFDKALEVLSAAGYKVVV